MKQFNYVMGVAGMVTTLLMPFMANSEEMIDWSTESTRSASKTPNIRKCDDQPGVKLGKNWNWHYPKETPKVRNGNKALLCKSGKKGILYTRSDIEGKYFVTNDKYLKVTPVLDNACAAIRRYCSPKITEQPPVKHKNYAGITYLFPPGVYTPDDIQQLASGQVQNKPLLAVFERSGWIKSGAPVSMNELPSKNAQISSLAGLQNDDREVMSLMRIDHGGTTQPVIATWNIATEQLVRMVALPPSVYATNVVAPDRHAIFAIDYRIKGQNNFVMFDTRTGKLIKEIYKASVGKLVISPNGQYIAGQTEDKPREGELIRTYWRVWRISDAQEMANYSGMVACFGHRNLTGSGNFSFSPDSSKFHIGWDCGKSTTEDGDFSDGKRYGWLGSTETWQAARVDELDGRIGDGIFSADGKLLVTYSQYYDLSSQTIHDFSHCKGKRNKLGKPIPDTPLHLFITDDKYEFRTAITNKCHVVASGPVSFNSDYSKSVLLTGDRKQIVSLKEKSGVGKIEVFSINFPDTTALSKLRDSARKDAKHANEAAEEKAELDKIVDEAQKLYDAGFAEQAMDILDQYVERPDTPPNGLITNAAVLWAKKLPLERVGKTLLNMYQKRLSQPIKAADGFLGDDTISVSEGFLVKDVFPGSNAARAGLRKADIVLALNGAKVNSDAEFNELKRNYKPGDAVELTIARNDTRQKISITLEEALPKSGAVWAVFHLLEYGMVAAAAGHPDLTLEAANEAQRISDKYQSSLHKEKIKSFITALKALHMASKDNVTKAYAYAVKEGGFVTGDFKLLSTFYVGSKTYSDFWTPLYKDRKKLAYLLQTKESELPDTPTYKFGKQPYPNMKGQLTKITGKKKSPPKKSKVTILDD